MTYNLDPQIGIDIISFLQKRQYIGWFGCYCVYKNSLNPAPVTFTFELDLQLQVSSSDLARYEIPLDVSIVTLPHHRIDNKLGQKST